MTGGEDRGEQRVKALIRVRLRGAGPEREACILDISSRGLLLTTADPPARGEFVEIVAGNHSLVGQVRWAGARRFGIGLQERIDIFALMQGERGPITVKARAAARPAATRSAAAALAANPQTAHIIQFAFLAVAAMVAAALLAVEVNTWLANTMGQVTAALQRPVHGGR